MNYKFVSKLSDEDVIKLKEVFTQHLKHRVRVRAHSLLLSNEGYKIQEIAKLYKVHINTVSEWINSWDSCGLSMLFEAQGRGRKPIYSEKEIQKLLSLVDEEPHQLKRAQSLMEKQTGKRASLDTIKRTLKKTIALNE